VGVEEGEDRDLEFGAGDGRADAVVVGEDQELLPRDHAVLPRREAGDPATGGSRGGSSRLRNLGAAGTTGAGRR
jgi:hypothetical protein